MSAGPHLPHLPTLGFQRYPRTAATLCAGTVSRLAPSFAIDDREQYRAIERGPGQSQSVRQWDSRENEIEFERWRCAGDWRKEQHLES